MSSDARCRYIYHDIRNYLLPTLCTQASVELQIQKDTCTSPYCRIVLGQLRTACRLKTLTVQNRGLDPRSPQLRKLAIAEGEPRSHARTGPGSIERP